MSKSAKLLIFIAFLMIAFSLGAIAHGMGRNVSESEDAAKTAQTTTLPAAQAPAPTGYSDVAEAAVNSVVNISSTKVVQSQTPNSPFFNDPFFRHFFGDPGQGIPRERRERALGSGVIVTADGYILTNNHVVADAQEIKVILLDGSEETAKVIGTDPKSDLAVVKVEHEGLTPLPLGDSDALRLGEVVLAIGNPFGLSHTVTMGIVSAKSRANVGIVDYEDFIQTDAAINPGNSGGALINTRGELVGINTAIASRSGGYQGVGFAIPVNMARSIMNSLIKFGKVTRGYVGVMIQDVRPEIAKAFGLDKPGGALIADVMAGGPGDEAGLKRGDVVIEYNGTAITDSAHFRNLVSQTEVDQEAKLTIIRDKKKMALTMKIAARPDDENLAQPASTEPDAAGVKNLGVRVQTLDPLTAQRYDLPAHLRGVVVGFVQPGSPADEAGLIPGDVILEVDRQAIADVAQFQKQMKKAGDAVVLLINRKGQTVYTVVKLD
ncbi:MAG TPA: DegQ family serine endoprotease [bacterium]|nr:DegQ family serine endoprotease [bacterium]